MDKSLIKKEDLAQFISSISIEMMKVKKGIFAIASKQKYIDIICSNFLK